MCAEERGQSGGQRNLASSQQPTFVYLTVRSVSAAHTALRRMSLDQINQFVMIHRWHRGAFFSKCTVSLECGKAVASGRAM